MGKGMNISHLKSDEARDETGGQCDESEHKASRGRCGRVAVVRVATTNFANRRTLVGALVTLIWAVVQSVAATFHYAGQCNLRAVIDVGRIAGNL